MKKPTHKIYRTTNWPAYNRALMSRGNIAIWFDPATQWYAPSKGKQGRMMCADKNGSFHLVN